MQTQGPVTRLETRLRHLNLQTKGQLASFGLLEQMTPERCEIHS